MPDILHSDAMNVIHDNAAGLDVHKMQVTATVRRSRIGQEAEMFTDTFSALPSCYLPHYLKVDFPDKLNGPGMVYPGFPHHCHRDCA